jgi:hypothetical protein
MYIENLLFYDECGFIEEPDAAIKNECPICKHSLKIASGDMAVILNMIRLNKEE